MIVLALETSTLVGGAALVRDGRVLGQARTAEGVTHSITLMPEVRRLLDGAGVSPKEIDLFVAGVGPGSFTGIRIGLAAAKGLARGAGKPLVGAPSPDILVNGLPPSSLQACPLVSARKDLAFAALYEPAESGYSRRTDLFCVTLPELAAMIDRPTVFFGDGPAGWEKTLEELLGDQFQRGPAELNHPRAADAARLGIDLFAKGVPSDPAGVIPLYVRPPDIWPMKTPSGPGLRRFARPGGQSQELLG